MRARMRQLEAENAALRQENATLHERALTKSALSDSMDGVMTDGYWDWHVNGDYEYMSPGLWRMLGYDPATKRHHPSEWMALIFEDDLKVALANFERHVATRGEHPFCQDVRYRHADGSTVWVRCRGEVVEWNEDGTARRVVGAHSDITEHMATLERFELLVAGTHVGIWDWNIQTDESWWSPKFYELLGDTPNAYPAAWSAVLARIHPADREAVEKAVAAHLEDDVPYAVEYRIAGAEGAHRWYLAEGQVVRDPDGTPRRMVGSLADIHDRKLSELRLRQSNEELTRFAYAASHDMKAPLRHIKSFAGLLETELGSSLTERGCLLLGYMTQGVSRMDQVVDGVLTLAKVGVAELTPMHSTVAGLLDEASRVVHGHSASETERTPTPIGIELVSDAPIFCQPDLMVRVFQNALENALQYARPDVRPRVRVMAETTRIHTEITIEDNGLGIAPRYRERVFRIFSRISQDKEGTGIGLAICQKIVSMHDGEIWFDDPTGEHGARLRIRLPL